MTTFGDIVIRIANLQASYGRNTSWYLTFILIDSQQFSSDSKSALFFIFISYFTNWLTYEEYRNNSELEDQLPQTWNINSYGTRVKMFHISNFRLSSTFGKRFFKLIIISKLSNFRKFQISSILIQISIFFKIFIK